MSPDFIAGNMTIDVQWRVCESIFAAFLFRKWLIGIGGVVASESEVGKAI